MHNRYRFITLNICQKQRKFSSRLGLCGFSNGIFQSCSICLCCLMDLQLFIKCFWNDNWIFRRYTPKLYCCKAVALRWTELFDVFGLLLLLETFIIEFFLLRAAKSQFKVKWVSHNMLLECGELRKEMLFLCFWMVWVIFFFFFRKIHIKRRWTKLR